MGSYPVPYDDGTLAAIRDLISWKHYQDTRDLNIYLAVKGGMTVVALSRITGLSRSHIHKIIHDQQGPF